MNKKEYLEKLINIKELLIEGMPTDYVSYIDDEKELELKKEFLKEKERKNKNE